MLSTWDVYGPRVFRRNASRELVGRNQQALGDCLLGCGLSPSDFIEQRS
jgi:hypothetical protein